MTAVLLSFFSLMLSGAIAYGAPEISLANLDYLLAVDRLEYYSEFLANTVGERGRGDLSQAIHHLKPKDFADAQFSRPDLDNPERWNELILGLLQEKNPSLRFATLKDIEWNYGFFRRKLMEGFKTEAYDVKSRAKIPSPPASTQKVAYALRTIPKIRAEDVLLDTELYISEKTTRAVFWDSALNNREIEFHMGTERDFRQRLQAEGRELVAEVKPRAHNYNKIYIVLDPLTGRTTYAFTGISGDDRVKHLIAQIRMVNYEEKNEKLLPPVRVYGNANEVHRQQESSLVDLFRRLPKADMVVIGQKGALEGVIAAAGMMAQLQPNPELPVGTDKSPLRKLSQRVVDSGSYFSVITKHPDVKTAFEKAEGTIDERFEVFTSEQPSHEITDVLLETKDSRIVRWRLISNMWGDEVVPVARALKDSGHDKVVYIGTAGGLLGKGLKVGDVVAPSKTYTQAGKLLDLEAPSYGKDFVKSGQVLGQVTSPYQETKLWLREWQDRIDLVELETGYLKENLGPGVSFQSYLLVSDVVGSTDESLSSATNDAGKRKRGQMRLLESLFLENDIRAAVSNFEMVSSERETQAMYRRIDALRASRDTASKLQLTQLALRQSLKTDAELEVLIKSEPAFDRQLMMDKLERFSSALEGLAARYSRVSFALTGGDEFLNGTWNPKKPLILRLMVGQLMASQAQALYAAEIESLRQKMGTELKIEFVSYDAKIKSVGVPFNSESRRVLESYYESKILKKMSFLIEIDRKGGVRLREVVESAGGFRCNAIF